MSTLQMYCIRNLSDLTPCCTLYNDNVLGDSWHGRLEELERFLLPPSLTLLSIVKINTTGKARGRATFSKPVLRVSYIKLISGLWEVKKCCLLLNGRTLSLFCVLVLLHSLLLLL